MHRSKKRKLMIAVDVLLLLLLVFLAVGIITGRRNKDGEGDGPSVSPEEGKTDALVYLDGKAYRENKAIEKFLLIGVDSEGEMKSNGGFENNIKSDFVTMVVLDREKNSYSLLYLNRDTVTEVPIRGIGGVAGSDMMQLALAYTYGDGMNESCINTAKAVENLLFGIETDHYFAVNMNGMIKLVDMIGGVDVTIKGDFSKVDPTLVEGEKMHLDGEKCMTYIRGRQGVGDESNLQRAERQRDFIKEFIGGISKQSSVFSVNVMSVANHIVSDLDATGLSDMAERLSKAEFTDIYTPEGSVSEDGEYIEFHADDQALRKLVVSLFYKEVVEE